MKDVDYTGETPEKTGVVIADCDENFTAALSKHINLQPRLEVRSIVRSGEAVNPAIERTGARVLILDLILPVLDGLAVLSRLSRLPRKPDLIIVTSVMSQELLVKRATELGADYYVIKPTDTEELAEKIAYLSNIFTKGGNSGGGTGAKNDLPMLSMSMASTVRENSMVVEKPILNIRKETTRLLHEIGIPANLKGHNYIRDAVIMVLEDRKLINSVTKTIYPNIGRRYQTSACSVERAIRTALETAWTRGRTDIINDIFGFTVSINKGKPTNAEFIAMLADKLSLECS